MEHFSRDKNQPLRPGDGDVRFPPCCHLLLSAWTPSSSPPHIHTLTAPHCAYRSPARSAPSPPEQLVESALLPHTRKEMQMRLRRPFTKRLSAAAGRTREGGPGRWWTCWTCWTCCRVTSRGLAQTLHQCLMKLHPPPPLLCGQFFQSSCFISCWSDAAEAHEQDPRSDFTYYYYYFVPVGHCFMLYV